MVLHWVICMGTTHRHHEAFQVNIAWEAGGAKEKGRPVLSCLLDAGVRKARSAPYQVPRARGCHIDSQIGSANTWAMTTNGTGTWDEDLVMIRDYTPRPSSDLFVQGYDSCEEPTIPKAWEAIRQPPWKLESSPGTPSRTRCDSCARMVPNAVDGRRCRIFRPPFTQLPVHSVILRKADRTHVFLNRAERGPGVLRQRAQEKATSHAACLSTRKGRPWRADHHEPPHRSGSKQPPATTRFIRVNCTFMTGVFLVGKALIWSGVIMTSLPFFLPVPAPGMPPAAAAP